MTRIIGDRPTRYQRALRRAGLTERFTRRLRNEAGNWLIRVMNPFDAQEWTYFYLRDGGILQRIFPQMTPTEEPE